MVLTISAIVAFQAYWLKKNYAEEKRLFAIHTNLLFRETIFKLQASRMHLDSSFDFSIQEKAGLVTYKKMLKNAVVKDSGGTVKAKQSFIITLDHTDMDGEADSAEGHMLFRGSHHKLASFLAGIDSLEKPITAEEITVLYRRELAKEGIFLPFRITAGTGDRQHESFSADGVGNKVMAGFSKPLLYQVDFDHSFWFMARRVGPQAAFSLVLIGITVFSFLLLYRNWQRQRRLTELKNDFISNITHELKTPIATVSVAVEALRNFNALQDPVRTREYLDISADELQRLSLLVDKVLKLSLFERQEIELKSDYFDLRTLVEDVMASMRLQFEKYEAKVVLAAATADFRLRADKLHITSVIFNLLDNALKYGKPHPSITIDLGAEQGQLVLAVIDNGLGIPAAYREKIFEKFFRVPTGDKHNVKGYGMGLSYVYYVLKRQGGTISVSSEEGIGSRFTVKIPRNDV
jgi:two-component system phosphate regulon sensor histidine kinase PhoR